MDVRQLLELYLHHVLSHRASYSNQRRLIHQAFSRIQDQAVDVVTPLEISRWRVQLSPTPTHANKALKTLRAAYRWGASMQLLTCDNPTLGIRPLPVTSRDRTMTGQEWEQAVEPSLDECAPKQRTFFLHVYMMACRPIEARLTRKEDLHLDDRLWHKQKMKTGRRGWMPLTERLTEALKELIAAGDPASPWVYQGKDPMQPVCETWAREMWRRHRRRHRLPDDIWLYDFRRSCVTDLDEAGASTRTNQQILGHESLEHTSTYIRPRLERVRQVLQEHEDLRLGRQVSLFPIPHP